MNMKAPTTPYLIALGAVMALTLAYYVVPQDVPYRAELAGLMIAVLVVLAGVLTKKRDEQRPEPDIEPRMAPTLAQRLTREWIKHGKLIIACDFDDTVSPWLMDTPKDHARYKLTLELLVDCQREGAHVIPFTASDPARYPKIRQLFQAGGVDVLEPNKNLPNLPFGNWGKLYANVYLDDRAGLEQARAELKAALDAVREHRRTNSPVRRIGDVVVDDGKRTIPIIYDPRERHVSFLIGARKQDNGQLIWINNETGAVTDGKGNPPKKDERTPEEREPVVKTVITSNPNLTAEEALKFIELHDRLPRRSYRYEPGRYDYDAPLSIPPELKQQPKDEQQRQDDGQAG